MTSILLDKTLWMWGVFAVLIILLLSLDLGLLHRKQKEISVKNSLLTSLGYISVGLAFSLYVYWELGSTKTLEYLTGFVVEKSLSLDNIFVIVLIFQHLAIPRRFQHRVLFWGILGAIIFRGIMIGIGSELVHSFSWVLYIFAIFLIFTGIKMWLSIDKPSDIGENFLLKKIKKYFRITHELHEERFFVRLPDQKNKLRIYLTPLFLALLMIELTDVIFAIDSVPAIFSITTDTYIVYTSNIFAILGLRALYFALAAMMERFHYLKYALSILLVFIGSKIFITFLISPAKFPAWLLLSITFGVLATGIIFSMWKTRKTGIKKNQRD